MKPQTVKHGKMKVVPDAPWRTPLLIGGVSLLGIACLATGFWLGREERHDERVASTLLRKELDRTEARASELDAGLIDARLGLDVQREATNTLRGEIQAQHGEIAALREEVTFYKNLMAPGELSDGLQVAELELREIGAQTWEFDLLLTQIASRRAYIAGDLRLDVAGSYRGEGGEGDADIAEAVLSLTELADNAEYPLKFRFRYFQNVTGTLRLPDDFRARQVLVTAHQRGREALQVTFPWPQPQAGR